MRFDKDFYIGRVLAVNEDNMISITYLHRIRGGNRNEPKFQWPRRRDVEENLHVSFIFFGPITLLGNDPFTVEDFASVSQAYTKYSKIK